MNTEYSRPDTQVRGLGRLFPTPLAKSLVIALPTSSIAVFWAVLNYFPPVWLGIQNQVQLLVASVAAITTGLTVALLLLLEFIDIINKRKRSTIYHDNYTSKAHIHIAYAVFLSTVMFLLGFYVAKS